ncbi:hypothetical protein SCACP_24490 [Sporomusa carbonis]
MARKKQGWPRYDKAKADHAVGFINALKHTKGVWHGVPFDLLPWQDKIIRDIFGMMKESGYLMKLVMEKRLAHGGQPVLDWMMDNIYVKTDPAGNIKPDKEKSTEPIDGAVALIMALDRAIRNDNKTSVYDGRGILVL